MLVSKVAVEQKNCSAKWDWAKDTTLQRLTVSRCVNIHSVDCRMVGMEPIGTAAFPVIVC